MRRNIIHQSFKSDIREHRQKLIKKQKIMGIGIIIISVLAVAVVSTGTSVNEKDATAVIISALIGLYLVFTKKIVISR